MEKRIELENPGYKLNTQRRLFFFFNVCGRVVLAGLVYGYPAVYCESLYLYAHTCKVITINTKKILILIGIEFWKHFSGT